MSHDIMIDLETLGMTADAAIVSIASGWPLTGVEVLQFWAIILAAAVVCLGIVLLVTGQLPGLNMADIVGNVLGAGL